MTLVLGCPGQEVAEVVYRMEISALAPVARDGLEQGTRLVEGVVEVELIPLQDYPAQVEAEGVEEEVLTQEQGSHDRVEAEEVGVLSTLALDCPELAEGVEPTLVRDYPALVGVVRDFSHEQVQGDLGNPKAVMGLRALAVRGMKSWKS